MPGTIQFIDIFKLAWTRIRQNKLLWIVVSLGCLLFALVPHRSPVGLLAARRQPCPPPPNLATIRQVENVDPDPFTAFTSGPECTVTRPEIHRSFTPKCVNKQQLLEALSSGGRYGFDQPYSALGCDMNWYTTQQICSILSHYSHIHLAGDSLIRQISVAMHILLREDLVEGGRATWRKDNPEATTDVEGNPVPAMDCRCRILFKKGSNCMWWEAINTDQVWADDPQSMKCGRDTANFYVQQMPNLNFVTSGLDGWIDSIKARPGGTNKRNSVFILGAGSWQFYNSSQTMDWLDAIEDGMRKRIPSFFKSRRLWISPPAKGLNVDPRYWNRSNNIDIQHHVQDMDTYVTHLGYDHLRVYNLTVQASSPDGTHTSLENTLVEAMMILNWLDMVKDER